MVRNVEIFRTGRYNVSMMNNSEPGPRLGRPITRNRTHVLETAMSAYWRDEKAAVSVNAICTLAEVSKPSLYREFGSEDGLTVAVLELYASRVLARVGEMLLSDAGFTAKLDALINFASEDPQMKTGCLFVKMRSARSRFGIQTQAKLSEIETKVLGLYVRFFRDSSERGEWSGNIPAELAANYLMEQLGLAITQRAAGRSRETVKELLTLSLSALKRA